MMNESTGLLFPREQFRMDRLQVFNWGTFSGLHDIPVSERGFLFVGPSGSGKSTLLDAFSALLIPPRWVDFNAAAREAERTGRDRNFVTYVRGAWGEQKDGESGLIGKIFLRAETTWSALSLSYKNDGGQSVTLVQLFWIRGKSTATSDVKRYYLIFERPFDLNEIRDFDLDIRKLKNSFPEAFVRDDFNSYCERFRRILGIESEMALRLLHKTQSAKNLGDLNTFLRNFMLEKPETFEVADRLVSEFGELSAAHQAVIEVRDQIAVLRPAREEHCLWVDSSGESTALEELRSGTDGFLFLKREELIVERINELKSQSKIIGAQAQEVSGRSGALKANLKHLSQLRSEAGGDKIEDWKNERDSLELQRIERSAKRQIANTACSALDWSIPSSVSEFAEIASRAKKEAEEWQESSEQSKARQIEIHLERSKAEEDFQRTSAEVRALKSQSSNISAEKLELRRQLAVALGLSEMAFPFVGELIEVREEELEWQGAIERSLRGFALSLLVEERHYSAFSNYVNSSDLRQKLIYHRVGGEIRPSTRSVGTNSLIHKLRIKQGDYEDWLNAELRQRFDYVCAESMQVFRNAEYAITREGQMRFGKSRHEKDDRPEMKGRRTWVLGFSNKAKLALFEAEAQELAQKISQLQGEINGLERAEKVRLERYGHCRTLMNLQWSEIDVEILVQRIATIEQNIRETLSKNKSLREIEVQITEVEKSFNFVEQELKALQVKLAMCNEKIEENGRLQDELKERLIKNPLSSAQEAGLSERMVEMKVVPSLTNIDELVRKMTKSLTDEIEKLQDKRSRLEREIEKRFAEFKRLWQSEAADMDAKIASASDFAKLDRLERDGLPKHEERFFELLRNQSHQNLAALSTHMNQARKEIAARLELVNEGLGEAAFNPGTYLHIQSSDRQLPEVRQFKHEVQQALSHAWDDNREGTESRFLILKKLVERLSSEVAADRRWRETVLDVRQHAEFIGRELDQEGREIEVYRSGSGKSGGQRQKLATTCLAAALRYQLGGHERGHPVYAPVILDEAFDKADNEFTALAMNIFSNFGFQMIVATPLKSVMTLEPFIGGACIVDIRDRKQSGVLLIEYDSTERRLRLPNRYSTQKKVEKLL